MLKPVQRRIFITMKWWQTTASMDIVMASSLITTMAGKR